MAQAIFAGLQGGCGTHAAEKQVQADAKANKDERGEERTWLAKSEGKWPRQEERRDQGGANQRGANTSPQAAQKRCNHNRHEYKKPGIAAKRIVKQPLESAGHKWQHPGKQKAYGLCLAQSNSFHAWVLSTRFTGVLSLRLQTWATTARGRGSLSFDVTVEKHGIASCHRSHHTIHDKVCTSICCIMALVSKCCGRCAPIVRPAPHWGATQTSPPGSAQYAG